MYFVESSKLSDAGYVAWGRSHGAASGAGASPPPQGLLWGSRERRCVASCLAHCSVDRAGARAGGCWGAQGEPTAETPSRGQPPKLPDLSLPGHWLPSGALRGSGEPRAASQDAPRRRACPWRSSRTLGAQPRAHVPCRHCPWAASTPPLPPPELLLPALPLPGSPP